MEKTILVGDKELKLKSSAAVPRMYRLKFRKDIFHDLTKLKDDFDKAEKAKKKAAKEGLPYEESSLPIESLELFENIAYIFARHADPSSVPDTIDEWLEEFECFDIYDILPEILELWGADNQTFSTPKKGKG